MKRVAGCEVMQGQNRILVQSPDSTLMPLHRRGKLTASLAHIGAGGLRAKDAIHDIPPSLRGKGVLHVHQRFPERFRWRVGNEQADVKNCLDLWGQVLKGKT